MGRGSTGHAVTTTTAGEVLQAFVPNPLPPVPPLAWSPSLRKLHDAALLACGRLDGVLDGVSVQVPEISNRLLYAYVRREALLSSEIEGTQSSLSDLLLFELDEAPGAPWADVTEVSSAVAALEHGLHRLADGFPYRPGFCGRCMGCCWPVVGVQTRRRESSGAARTGLAEPVLETHVLFPHHLNRWRIASPILSGSSMPKTTCPFWSKLPWPMSSWRPSTRFRTATVALAVC